VDITDACVYDKTKRCSMFGKGAVNYAMTEMKKKAAEARKLSCSDSLGLCMMRFYYSALGVLQGEVMMTKFSKTRDYVTSQVSSLNTCDHVTSEESSLRRDHVTSQESLCICNLLHILVAFKSSYCTYFP
jgi:hypothetical protein